MSFGHFALAATSRAALAVAVFVLSTFSTGSQTVQPLAWFFFPVSLFASRSASSPAQLIPMIIIPFTAGLTLAHLGSFAADPEDKTLAPYVAAVVVAFVAATMLSIPYYIDWVITSMQHAAFLGIENDDSDSDTEESNVVPQSSTMVLPNTYRSWFAQIVFPTSWVGICKLLGLASPLGSWGNPAYANVTAHASSSENAIPQLAALFGIDGILFMMAWFGTAVCSLSVMLSEYFSLVQEQKAGDAVNEDVVRGRTERSPPPRSPDSGGMSWQQQTSPSRTWSQGGDVQGGGRTRTWQPANSESAPLLQYTKPAQKLDRAWLIWRTLARGIFTPPGFYSTILVLCLLYGNLRPLFSELAEGRHWLTAPDEDDPVKQLHVGCLVSKTNLDTDALLDATGRLAKRLEVVDRHDEADHMRLVMWSEEAAGIYSASQESTLHKKASSLSASTSTHLLIAYTILPNETSLGEGGIEAGSSYNRMAFFLPNGTIAFVHQKRHPVPFVERGYVPGDAAMPAVVETAFGKVAGAICFDLDFPGWIAHAGRRGAKFMLQSSWTWEAIALPHARGNILRAIENDFTLIRCASDGYSGIYSPLGATLADRYTWQKGLEPKIDAFVMGDVEVPMRVVNGEDLLDTVPTLFVLGGFVFGWVCAVAVGVIGVVLCWGWGCRARRPGRR